MVVRCRSSIIAVETERDCKMAYTPIELQARIRRLFLKCELETQFQKNSKRIEPNLNTLETPKGDPLRIKMPPY
jgi:hypothetical protein